MTAPSPLDQLFRDELVHLLQESLKKIGHCVGQLNEAEIWHRPAPEMNSIGNLMLHIAGNLRQWAICGITGQADHRDRASEFADCGDQSRDDLMQHVTATVDDAIQLIRQLPPDAPTEKRQIQGFDVTVAGALMHTVPHFVGHTHQIIQLTRMLRGSDYRFAWTPDDPRDGVPL